MLSRRDLWFGTLDRSIPGVGGKRCPQTQTPLRALLVPGTRRVPVLEQLSPSLVTSVLLVLKQYWEEIFCYSKEPCLIISVTLLMNYKELMLLAKDVTDAVPWAEFFCIFVLSERNIFQRFSVKYRMIFVQRGDWVLLAAWKHLYNTHARHVLQIWFRECMIILTTMST